MSLLRFTVLLAYEYVVTFGDEVALVWKKRATVTSILFISVRWTMVAYAIIGLTPGTPEVSYNPIIID